MANVDNLNFKVIIDDAQFNKKIKAMEDMAKRFNTSVSNILNIKAVSQDLVLSNRKMRQMETDNLRAAELQNREKMKSEALQRKLNAQVQRTTKEYQSQSRILQELKGYALGYLSIHGVSQLLSSLVRVTGEFELQKTTLAAMLGDLNQAETIIARIQSLAVESPFQFKELTTYAKQLSAFSVPAQELYDTTKMLADISAGLGVGMDRIVLAYGQVRSAAFLRGQEVRQFTEAGIPILDELAKQFSELEGRAVSTGEVFDKISARLVPFEMVAKVLKEMTSEGGKFYQMQEIQAETLKGKISNLKDAYEVMLNEIGSAHTEELKSGVDMVRKMVQNYEELGKTIAATVITFGVARTAIEVLSVTMGNMALKSATVVRSLRNVQAFALKNPYVLIAAGITATGVALYKASTTLKDYEKVQHSVVESKDRFNKSVSTEIAKLDTLYAKLRLAKKGTEEYDSAKKQIFSQYSGYISELKAEGVAVNNLATVYVNLKNKISEANKERFLSSATKEIEKTYAEGLDKLYKRFELISKNIGNTIGRELMAVEKESLWQYILGDDKALNIPEAEGIRGIVKDIYGGYGLVVERAQKDAKKLSDAYTQGLSDIQKALDLTQRKQEQSSSKLVDGWRKTVQDTLKGMGLDKGTSFGLWAEDTTQSTSYVEDMIKRYKELKEEIKWVSSFDSDQAERLKKNKDAIEAIAKALNIDIKNLSANDSDTKESKEERRINRLIEALRKLQDQYEKLKALGVSDDSIKKLFEGMFPELVKEQGKDFVTGLNYVDKAKTLIEELRKLNPEAADKALITLSADNTSDYVNKLDAAIKATRNYYESMRKLASEDFNLGGNGIALDISKIASDLKSKMGEIDLSSRKLKENLMSIDLRDSNVLAGVKDAFNKEFGEGSWDAFYAEFLSKGDEAIRLFASKQIQYEKKLAQEKMTDLASRYVSEKVDGLNLSDWGDKSLSQIEYIRQRLIALKNEDIKLPKSVIDSLAELGLSTDALKEKIKEIFGEKIQDATVEKFKELSDLVGEVKSKANELGGQLIELGETVDSDFLRSFGKSLQFANELTDILSECDFLIDAFAKGGEKAGEQVEEIVDATSEVAESSEEAAEGVENIGKSSDWVTMVIKLVVSLIGKVVNGINESQQALHEARLAAIEYANALKQIEFDRLLGASESIFGTDAYGQFKSSMQEMEKYLNNIKEAQKQIGVTKKELTNAYFGPTTTLFGDTEDIAKNLGHQLDDILVDSRTSWQKFWGTGKDAFKTFNMSDFIDKDGILDGDKLRKFYNAYKDDISNKNRKAIEIMLGDWDLYVQAMKNVTSYMTSLMDNAATDMADAFITSFKESGQAALEYGDIMNNVATEIARSVVKSTILQNVFDENDAKEAAKKLASGDTGGAMAIVEEAMQAAQDLAPYIQELLKSLEPYFQMGEESGQSLSDGIKGMTEDTANLLASYLNAIRADVSYARTIWERMDATTQQIAVILTGFSAPSLMEYQMQIAANTYNTAMNTQSIMEDLRSVITSTDGPAGIRVYS